MAMINKTDIHKFSFPEAVSSGNGKTSGSAVCGMFMIFVGTACFAYATFTKQQETLIHSLALVGMGTGLIAVKKLNPTKDTTNTKEDE